MKITVKMLRDLRACSDQVDRFRALFPAGAKVTKSNVELAVAASLNIRWAADNLLSPAQRAEYDRIEGPARAEYDRIEGAALAEYDRIEGPAWAEYDRIKGAALAEYCRIKGAALAEYLRVVGAAFLSAARIKGGK
jgi:hypothetical protein